MIGVRILRVRQKQAINYVLGLVLNGVVFTCITPYSRKVYQQTYGCEFAGEARLPDHCQLIGNRQSAGKRTESAPSAIGGRKRSGTAAALRRGRGAASAAGGEEKSAICLRFPDEHI